MENLFRHLRPVWAEVDLDKLAYNMREIRKIAKSKNIIAVVKADGYGHGAIDIAPVLLQNGANGLAVAVISEAVSRIKKIRNRPGTNYGPWIYTS